VSELCCHVVIYQSKFTPAVNSTRKLRPGPVLVLFHMDDVADIGTSLSRWSYLECGCEQYWVSSRFWTTLTFFGMLWKFSLRYDQRKVSGLLYCAFDQDYSGPGLKKIAGFSTIFQEGNFRFPDQRRETGQQAFLRRHGAVGWMTNRSSSSPATITGNWRGSHTNIYAKDTYECLGRSMPHVYWKKSRHQLRNDWAQSGSSKMRMPIALIISNLRIYRWKSTHRSVYDGVLEYIYYGLGTMNSNSSFMPFTWHWHRQYRATWKNSFTNTSYC